jgi:colanic acid/amylovoran biosynthesis protein
MGVDALLSGTIASIQKSLPNAGILLLDFNKEKKVFTVPPVDGGTPVQVPLVNLRFSWKLWLGNNGFRLLAMAVLFRLIPLQAVRSWLVARHPALGTIRDASFALSLAGGDSFSDIYGFRRLLYVCLPQLLVLAMSRPLVVLPQTLGPFKAGWARRLGAFLMDRAAKVYSRDHESLRIAKEMLGEVAPGHLAYSQDMAFALFPSAPETGLPAWAEKTGRPLVGLNVSGLLFMGGYTRSNMFGLEGDYPGLMRELIRWFTREADANVVLVTHVTGHESDATACRELHEQLAAECDGKLFLADPGYDHRQIKYLIGRCDFFLGARMHACIAALSQAVPAVGLAYSRKFAGVFESVDVGELVVDLRSVPAAQALANIADLYGRRAEFAGRLRTTAPVAREAAEGLIGRIAGAIAPAAPDATMHAADPVGQVSEPQGISG